MIDSHMPAGALSATPTSLARALVAFPPGLRVAEPPDEPGGPPKRFERVTRIPERHGLVRNGLPVALGPSDNSAVAENFKQFDIAELSVLAVGSSALEAFDVVQPVIEASLDAIAFQMQAALHVVSLDVLDATPPLRVGEERECLSHVPADTAVSGKFGEMPQTPSWSEYSVHAPDLREGPVPSSPRARMALWWYIKGLDTTCVVDKFIFFWTSLEILWTASDVKVETTYVTACGHTVESCPVCGRSVTRVVQGPSMRSFLAEQAEVDSGDAARLWQLRQVVHGKDVFDAEQAELSRLTAVLRAAVLRVLKAMLGEPLDQPPLLIWTPGLLLGNRMITLCIRRAVSESDVAAVQYLRALAT